MSGRGRNTWANGDATSERRIDHIAVSCENRNWATNVQTKGLASPNSPIKGKNYPNWHKVRYNKKYENIQASRHVDSDIQKLRVNATTLQRYQLENKKTQKLIQTRTIHRKIYQPGKLAAEHDQKVANRNSARSNKTWVKLSIILRIVQKHESHTTKHRGKGTQARNFTRRRRNRKYSRTENA